MGMNAVYKGAGDCPQVIPLFPLSGALLLPRGQMPLNIFEPRYLAMIDDAIRGNRVIGIIQPEPDDGRSPEVPPLLRVGCLGRITQFAETGDDRYIISLTGISRFRVIEELPVATPYRQARVDYEPFAVDFVARAGEEEVDRDGLLRALRDFAKANDLKIDWKGVGEAPNEALVNALVEDGSLPGLEASIKEYGTLAEQEPSQEDVVAATVSKQPLATADAAPRALYVHRDVVNAADIIAWAKGQGFESTLPADDLHVTVTFSRTPVDWMQMGQSWSGEDGKLRIPPGGVRMMERFGEATVLRLSEAQRARR